MYRTVVTALVATLLVYPAWGQSSTSKSTSSSSTSKSSSGPSSSSSSKGSANMDRYKPDPPKPKTDFERFSQNPPKREAPPTAVEKIQRGEIPSSQNKMPNREGISPTWIPNPDPTKPGSPGVEYKKTF